MSLRPLLALGLVLCLSSLVPVDAAVPLLAASGPGRHVLVEDDLIYKSCEEEAVVTLTYLGGPTGRTFIDVTGDGCVPTFSLLSGCQGVDGDGWFRCERRNSAGHIQASLSPGGVFTFAWDAPGFTERIWANMTRIPPTA